MTGGNNVSEFEVPVGFKINIGEIQEEQYKEESYPEEEYLEEDLEKQEVNSEIPEKETNEDDDDSLDKEEEEEKETDEYSDYSDSALIAIAEVREGLFEGLEEKDIPKDLDPLKLRELYRKSNEIILKQTTQEIASRAGDAAKYVEFLIEGGDPNAVKHALEFQDLLTLDPSKEEDQKTLLSEDLRRRGIEEDEIRDLVENILDKGKGKQKAESVLSNFKKAQDSILDSYKEEQERLKLEAQETYQETVETVQEIINKGEVNGIKLSKKDQKDLYDAIFTPTEIVEVPNPQTGKLQKIRASKIQVLQNELNNDYEKMISFYHWLLKGGKFDFVKEQAKEEEQDTLRSLLQGRRTSHNRNKTEKSSLDNLIKDLRRT